MNMKRYIKITNEGATPRDFLKIIGAGDDKTDDNSVFGQFKSGYKIASIIALRCGLQVIASSTDNEGPYVLEYMVRSKTIVHKGQEKIIPKIYYWHSDGKRHWTEESSFALNAFPKWAEAAGDDESKSYPILRELIANARDEDKNFRCEAGVEKIEMAAPGETAVYLEQTDDALRILGVDFPRYFKFFGARPIYEAPGLGAIYHKTIPGETRFFNCGYLIGCRKHKPAFHVSSFDYDVAGKDFISEERVLRDKDRGKYNDKLAKLLLSIRDKALLNKIIDAAMDSASYELEIIRHINAAGDLPPDFAALCREIWLERFGPKAILSSYDADNDKEAKNVLHYDVIGLFDSLKNFFKKAGIEDAGQKMASFTRELKERPPNPCEKEKIERIDAAYLNEYEYYRELVKKYPVTVLIDKSGSAAGIAFDYNRCGIAESRFAESDAEFLQTRVHELRHCATGLQDASDYRGLMRQADREIVYLLQYAAVNREEMQELKEEIKELNKYIHFLGLVIDMKRSAPDDDKK